MKTSSRGRNVLKFFLVRCRNAVYAVCVLEDDREPGRVLDLGVSMLHDTPLSEDDTDSHRIRRCGSSQSRCGNAYEHRSKLTSPFARSFHTSPRDRHAAHLQHPVSHSFEWGRPRIDHNEVHRFPQVLVGYGVDWNGYRQCTRHEWCC